MSRIFIKNAKSYVEEAQKYAKIANIAENIAKFIKGE